MLIAFAWLLSPSFVLAQQNVVVRARRQRQHRDRMTGNRNMSKMGRGPVGIDAGSFKACPTMPTSVCDAQHAFGNGQLDRPRSVWFERGEASRIRFPRISATGGTPLGERCRLPPIAC